MQKSLAFCLVGTTLCLFTYCLLLFLTELFNTLSSINSKHLQEGEKLEKLPQLFLRKRRVGVTALWLPIFVECFWRDTIVQNFNCLCLQSTHQQLSVNRSLRKWTNVVQHCLSAQVSSALIVMAPHNVSQIINASNAISIWQWTAAYTHSSCFFVRCICQLLSHCSFPRKPVVSWTVIFIKEIV